MTDAAAASTVGLLHDRGARSRHAVRSRALLTYAVLTVMACIILVPLLATLLGGFKTLGELRTNPIGLPTHWQWQNYLGILESTRYWGMLGNSMLIAGLTSALTLAAGSMAAFTFAH